MHSCGKNYLTQNNTETYRKIFGCYPDNDIKSLDQVKSFKKKVDKEDYDRETQNIHGHAVTFPLRFL
jgi:hypothetical protein